MYERGEVQKCGCEVVYSVLGNLHYVGRMRRMAQISASLVPCSSLDENISPKTDKK